MKGILFKPWKIIYIAEHPNIEIQTRRVIKIPKYGRIKAGSSEGFVMICFDQSGLADWKKQFAHYQQGETVYIKEAWAVVSFTPNYAEEYHLEIAYKVDGARRKISVDFYTWDKYASQKYYAWQTPMMMPEKFARYFITITDVRAERLQEITMADLYAEGCTRYGEIFPNIWDSLNAKYSWESNPWVWVYTFSLKGAR